MTDDERHDEEANLGEIPLKLEMSLREGMAIAAVLSMAIRSPIGAAIKEADLVDEVGGFLVSIHNAVIENYSDAIGDSTLFPDIQTLKKNPEIVEEAVKRSEAHLSQMEAKDVGMVEKPEDWVEGSED